MIRIEYAAGVVLVAALVVAYLMRGWEGVGILAMLVGLLIAVTAWRTH